MQALSWKKEKKNYCINAERRRAVAMSHALYKSRENSINLKANSVRYQFQHIMIL